MLTHTFVHPKEEERNGAVRIAVVNRPMDKDRKYYQGRLRLEAFPFENAKENRVYLELKADDGVFLANKLISVLDGEQGGEHRLMEMTTGKVNVELYALNGGDKKGIRMVVKGEQGNKDVFVALTLTRMSILAEMMKFWCLTEVPKIERARVQPEEELEEEGLVEEEKGEESVEEE